MDGLCIVCRREDPPCYLWEFEPKVRIGTGVDITVYPGRPELDVIHWETLSEVNLRHG
jgi:hypothetical protein